MKKFVAILALVFAACSHATTYHISTTGSDGANGLTVGTAWATPNHNGLVCGQDQILVEPGTYSSNQFVLTFASVSCPSGNNVAWVNCVTFAACIATAANGSPIWIQNNYWGVSGFVATVPSGPNGSCIAVYSTWNSPSSGIHHIIVANNVLSGCFAGGVEVATNGGYGVDYFAIVGNIIYNAAQTSTQCYSGIDVVSPQNSDSLPGTHIYIAGNFTWHNFDPATCGGGPSTDGNGIILDTYTVLSYTGQSVIQNNISFLNGADGINITTSGTGRTFVLGNTTWKNANDTNITYTEYSEIGSHSWLNMEVYGNLLVGNSAAGPGGLVGYVLRADGTTTRDVFYSNFGYSSVGHNTASDSGFSFGPNNTFSNPVYANPPTSDPGPPSCGSASSVPNCMAAMIANFTPTNAAAKTYGYQVPSSTSVYDPLYPQWLCTVTNLPTGLVTPGCTLASATSGVTLNGATLR